MTHLVREQTAAQIIALIQARFERPGLDDVDDILDLAKQQVRALRSL
jgi:hypothetical protein